MGEAGSSFATVLVAIGGVILSTMVLLLLFLFCRHRKGGLGQIISPSISPATIPTCKSPLSSSCSSPSSQGALSGGNLLGVGMLSGGNLRHSTPVPVELSYEPQTLADVEQEIVQLTRPLLAELRSYSSPPAPVHRTMEAVFILLGEERGKLKDWKFVLGLLNRSGSRSMVARIAACKKPAGKAVSQARSIVKGMSSQEVNAAGSQVTCLFTWVTIICRKDGKR